VSVAIATQFDFEKVAIAKVAKIIILKIIFEKLVNRKWIRLNFFWNKNSQFSKKHKLQFATLAICEIAIFAISQITQSDFEPILQPWISGSS